MLVGKKCIVAMVASSCIVGCMNRGTKGMSKKFYRIPKVVKNKGNEVKELTEKR